MQHALISESPELDDSHLLTSCEGRQVGVDPIFWTTFMRSWSTEWGQAHFVIFNGPSETPVAIHFTVERWNGMVELEGLAGSCP
jgi:hypothetical protein